MCLFLLPDTTSSFWKVTRDFYSYLSDSLLVFTKLILKFKNVHSKIVLFFACARIRAYMIDFAKVTWSILSSVNEGDKMQVRCHRRERIDEEKTVLLLTPLYQHASFTISVQSSCRKYGNYSIVYHCCRLWLKSLLDLSFKLFFSTPK